MGGYSWYIFRLTNQHRALYCYLVLSVWILILLGVMYKYAKIENDALGVLKLHTTDFSSAYFYRTINPLYRSPHVLEQCNPFEEIVPGAEGSLNSNFTLQGVLILIRHGDRGPLTHVQNISVVDCSFPLIPLYSSFENVIANISGSSTLSQLLGAFHGIPPLPNSECGLGLLTKVGASQLLALGKVLRNVYHTHLNINLSSIREEVQAYSTRYRRTIQSGLAFLFSFFRKEEFQRLTLMEAPSLAFCFDDCACPAADLYSKRYSLENGRRIQSRPLMLSLVKSLSSIVYEFPDRKTSSDPHALKDALLTYMCHNAKFPCIADGYSADRVCIKADHITTLFDYLKSERKQMAKSKNLLNLGTLRAYGLLKNIVSHLLRIVSEKKPKFVLYSGHDKTISYLATSLGVRNDEIVSPKYASRLIFEVYRSNDNNKVSSVPIGHDYFFRLLFDGRDVTRKVHFCKGAENAQPPHVGDVNPTKNEFYLCPIERLVRFLHEDYFLPFNASNIKDACSITTS